MSFMDAMANVMGDKPLPLDAQKEMARPPRYSKKSKGKSDGNGKPAPKGKGGKPSAVKTKAKSKAKGKKPFPPKKGK